MVDIETPAFPLCPFSRYEAAIPGSSDDLAALSVPTLFVSRYDTRARAAYSDWVSGVAPVAARELRQRASLVSSASEVAGAATTERPPEKREVGNAQGDPCLSPDPPMKDSGSSSGGASTTPEQEAEPAAFLTALRSSTELRDQALQRRDAALMALSQLSRAPGVGLRIARYDGVVARLALIIETTIGITDAPVLAAATLARVSEAPGAAPLVAAALNARKGLLQRILMPPPLTIA